MSTVAVISSVHILHEIFAALSGWGAAVPALVQGVLHLSSWGGTIPAESWGALVVG